MVNEKKNLNEKQTNTNQINNLKLIYILLYIIIIRCNRKFLQILYKSNKSLNLNFVNLHHRLTNSKILNS